MATAPSEGGRVNLSPKGYRDTFAVLDDHTVAYLDLFGSGVETIAHLRDNGRITIMFCSFTRNSRILRLFGTGRAVRPDDAEFPSLLTHFGDRASGVRAVIVIDVERIADACGYRGALLRARSTNARCSMRITPSTPRRRMTRTVRLIERNRQSIDGLPGLEADHPAPRAAGTPRSRA